jgi:hypothetical protein
VTVGKPAARLLNRTHGRRDRKIQGGRVERDQLRQQAHDTLGIFCAVKRDAIKFFLECHVDEASSRAATLHCQNAAILSLIESSAQHEQVCLLQGENAPQELVNTERRAISYLIVPNGVPPKLKMRVSASTLGNQGSILQRGRCSEVNNNLKISGSYSFLARAASTGSKQNRATMRVLLSLLLSPP